MTKSLSKNDIPVEGKVIYLLILIAIIQTIYPISSGGSILALIGYQILYMTMMVAGIIVARDNRPYMWILIIISATWLISGIYFALNPEAFWANILAYIFLGIFQGLIIYVLLKYIFATPKITRDAIYAACAVYLLLGAIFVPIYGTIETLTWFPAHTAHAFIDGANSYVGVPFPWQTIIYYSYATLTTLGYGDVLPVSIWARSAASAEAIIGVLYVTIIMARLVGLYASIEVEEDYESRQPRDKILDD